MQYTQFVNLDGTVQDYDTTTLDPVRRNEIIDRLTAPAPTWVQCIRSCIGLYIVGVGFWIGGQFLKKVFKEAYAESNP